LCNAQLELVELVARHEVELRDQHAHGAERLIRQPGTTAAQPRGQLDQQLLEDVGDPVATGRGHAASCCGAGGASRDVPPPTAPTATAGRRRRGDPAWARPRGPAPTPGAQRALRAWAARDASASRTRARAPSTS